MTTRAEKLIKKLSYLKEGEGIHLGNDVFLIGELDGSDKIYGFVRTDGELKVRTRGCSDGYPISDMDKEDLQYIFSLSTPNIYKKIQAKEYETVDANEV